MLQAINFEVDKATLVAPLKRCILDLSVTTSVNMKNDHDENANSYFSVAVN